MKDFTKGPVAKQLFYFALPMLLANVFQQLYSFTDSIIVGRFIGKQALAAVGASFPILYVLIAMVIGIGSGFTVVISQYFGAKAMERVKMAISTNFIFLFFASLVVSIVGFVFTVPIFKLVGVPEDVLSEGAIYFKIYISGQIAFFGFNGVSSVLRGLGDSKTPLVFTILSTVLNIGLDLLFVLVFNLGVAGVAWATVLAYAITFIVAVIYLNKTHDFITFRIKDLKFDKKIFKQSMRIGLPTGFQQTFVAMGMMAIMGIVSRFGTNVLAGFSAATRIDAIAVMPALQFGSALSAFVGQNVGVGNFSRAIKGHKVTVLLSGLIAITTSVFVILFARPLISLFTTDEAVIEEGVRYLVIVCSWYFLFSSMFSFHGLFRGAGDTLIPMIVTLMSLWVIRIPFAALMSKYWGVNGIWWALPIAWGVGLLLSYIYYLTGKWKTRAVVKAETKS